MSLDLEWRAVNGEKSCPLAPPACEVARALDAPERRQGHLLRSMAWQSGSVPQSLHNYGSVRALV